MANLGITGVSFVYCTKFCVLNRTIGHKQLILFGFPFSLWGSVCGYFFSFILGDEKDLCHRVKNKISQKDAKCIPSRVTAGIVICAGESFGVLRLGTSPQISFSNVNLIKQFTTCRLAISQNIPWLLPLPPPPLLPPRQYILHEHCLYFSWDD